MPTFYDAAGEEYDVPAGSEAGAAELGLSAAPPVAAASATVTMVDAAGEEYDVPADNAPAAAAELGLSPADPQGGGLGQLAAGAEGLMSGTFFAGMKQPLAALEGVGEYIGNRAARNLATPEAAAMMPERDLQYSLEQARAGMAEREAANPITSGVGTVAGALLPAVITGGASAAPAVAGLSERAAVAAASRVGIPVMQAATAAETAAKIATGTLGQRMIVAAAKAAVPSAIEGAAYGTAAGLDEGLEAAYLVDGELSRGDYAAVAESGAEGLVLGAGLGALAGAVVAPVAEAGGDLYAGARRLASGLFGKPAVQTPGVNIAVVDGAQDIIAQERAAMMPAAVDNAPVLPSGSSSLARVADDMSPPGTALATVGDDVVPPPFQNGLKQARTFDAEKLIDDQGPIRASAQPAETVGRAKAIAQALKGAGKFDEIEANAGRAITSKLDELAKLEDVSNTLNGIAAKRQWAAKFNDGIARPAHPETVATVKSVAGRLMSWLDDASDYSLSKMGGLGKAKKLAMGLQESANAYEVAMVQGRAGDAAMVLDDAKRMLGDFANAKNPALNTLVRGQDGKSGLYGELQRHLQDEQVFGAFAQAQAPVNATWASHITAAKDAETRGVFITAGEMGADSFENALKANQKWIKQWLGGTQKWEQESEHIAAIRLLRAKANDISARANVWGTPQMKADAVRAQKLVASIEEDYLAVAVAAKAHGKVAAFSEAVGDVPLVGGTVKTGTKIAKRLAEAFGSAPTASERVAQAAVEANATTAKAAKAAARMAVEPRKASATPVVSRYATLEAVNTYVRDTDPESPAAVERDTRAKDLQREAPELVQPLLSLNERKRSWIREKAGPLLQGRDPRNTLKLGRYIDATEHPENAIERISQGTVHPEDVETLWNVYPTRMAKFRDATMAAIAKSNEQPTREAKQKLDFAFRLHDPAYLQWLQQQQEQQPQQEQPSVPRAGGSPSKFAAGDVQTTADRLLTR